MENDFEFSSAQQGQPFFENPIDLRQYWQIILERRWLVITTFISILVLSIIYLFRATPIYQSVATIQIDRDTDQILQMPGFALDTPDPEYLQTQYKNLMSRSLLQEVLDDLKLRSRPPFSEMRDPIKGLAGEITISPIRLSRLVDIKVEDKNPELACEIANSLATNFVDLNLDKKKAKILRLAHSLDEEIEKQAKALTEKETNLDLYRRNKKIVSFEESQNVILQALKQAQTDYDTANGMAIEAETTVKQIDDFLKKNGSIQELPQVANNTDIQNLKRELAMAQAQFNEVKKRYRSKHPSYIAAESYVDSLTNSIDEQSRQLIDAVRQKATTLQAIADARRQTVKEYEQKQQELQKDEIDYTVLKRDVDSTAAMYASLLSNLHEKKLTADGAVQNIQIRDAAFPGYKAVKPRKLLTLFLGVFGGLAAAVGLAFFVNYIDDSVKSQDDVETFLRLPFLGYIPNIKTNSVEQLDLQSHTHPQSNAAEAFRTVRATVALSNKPEQLRILAVTSTTPSEGKSLIASNLAIVSSQTGLKTLLIDSDLRRPSVHKAFQLHSPKGLSNYLMDEVNKVEDLIHKTEVPNLHAICSGAVPTNPSELIGSKRMAELLKAMRENYDRIILDCPPISAVSDPLLISSMSDGVVYVMKFNKIRREHARKAIQRLHNAGIHVVGLVLNDIDFEGKDSYYYSYYYYQNQYYSSHYRAGAAEPEKTAVTPSKNGS